MVPMTFIWWIYHFWARFWPYFNFVDFRAYFGPFSLVNRDQQKMADFIMKMASNKKMQENKPTLKFNFTIEKRWGVSKFSFWHSHWALMWSLQSSIRPPCRLDWCDSGPWRSWLNFVDADGCYCWCWCWGKRWRQVGDSRQLGNNEKY